jgi:hypothetical protein
MNHHRSQILRRCLVFTNPQRNLMRRPLVLNHSGMVDRNVGGTLIEIGQGIAASLHYRAHQVVGLCDCTFRGINRARLHRLPAFEETFVFHRIKITKVELFNPLLTIG